jgi:ribonucleoside-diphosphate reductase alpha chain
MAQTKLPKERKSITHKFCVGGLEGYVTIGLYPDGSPGEMFLVVSGTGSMERGLFHTIAKLVSMALQQGVPLAQITRMMRSQKFDPAGITKNKDIPMAHSVVDYLAQWMEKKFII